jgi:hypothetical protein
MLTFSPLARQVIDAAVAELPNASQRAIWTDWAREHATERRIGGPADDDKGPLPGEVANIVLAALESMSARLRLRLAEPAISEDEISDLDNELSRIRSVERALYQDIQRHQ